MDRRQSQFRDISIEYESEPMAEPITKFTVAKGIRDIGAPITLIEDAIIVLRTALRNVLEVFVGIEANEHLITDLSEYLSELAGLERAVVEDPLRAASHAITIIQLAADIELHDDLTAAMSRVHARQFAYDGEPDTLDLLISRESLTAIRYAQEALAMLSPGDEEPPAAQLSSVLPTQKPAPLRFKVEADVLRVDHIPAEAEEDVARATAATRDQLTENGRALIEALKAAGNVDRRVLQTVEQLQTLLASQQDVVQLAIANIGAEFVFAGAEEEMSATLFGALRGLSQGIAMYAAQFPDWQKFAENAAAVDLTEQDVAAVVADARALVAKLESAAPNVDPEVPKTIAFLLDLIGKPAHTSKRAFFAVVRTLENLAASIFQRAANIWGTTLDGAAEGMKGGTKKVVTVALIAVAIQAATGLGPVAAKLPDAKWVTQALEIVKKQLETAPKG